MPFDGYQMAILVETAIFLAFWVTEQPWYAAIMMQYKNRSHPSNQVTLMKFELTLITPSVIVEEP